VKRDRQTKNAVAGLWWGIMTSLAIALAVSACSAPATSAPTSTAEGPPPTWTATPPATPTIPPTATPAPILTLPALPALPTVAPQPTVPPTPFPDEQAIVDTVVNMRGDEHWAAHRTDGSFTTAGAEEILALVGNIGDLDEVRWVIVAKTDAGYRLRGTSQVLATGFGNAPPHYFPPEPADFDGDGQQEVVVDYFKMQYGWITGSATLYRWDGQALATIWGAPTAVDNTMANRQDVPASYRENYLADWDWVDLTGDGVPEIVLQERVTFHPADESLWEEDDLAALGEEDGERAFRWDGQALRPFAPGGPAGTFAYVDSGELWLWRDRAARPLGARHVETFAWSQDGQRLAWSTQPQPQEAAERPTLSVWDAATGATRAFSLAGVPVAWRWTPDGRLAYRLPEGPAAILDPDTGMQEPLPAGSLGTWSPDGGRLVYERDGGLFIYEPATGQEWALVVAPEGGGQEATWALEPAWSPRGDWVACIVETPDFATLGLITPDASAPAGSTDLLETFDGREAPALQFAWSPDGAQLAALTADPRFEQRPPVLYVADVSPAAGDAVGRPEWREMLQLETTTGTLALAWSPAGERVTVAAGDAIWEVTTAGAATLRHRFAVPGLRWTTLAWAPDGSGYLAGLGTAGAGYTGHLYWFPADGSPPVLLAGGYPDEAHWSP